MYEILDDKAHITSRMAINDDNVWYFSFCQKTYEKHKH